MEGIIIVFPLRVPTPTANKTAKQIIDDTRKGSINREFPTEMKDKTLEDIQRLARKNGPLNAVAKKAWKLLNDNRFKK